MQKHLFAVPSDPLALPSRAGSFSAGGLSWVRVPRVRSGTPVPTPPPQGSSGPSVHGVRCGKGYSKAWNPCLLPPGSGVWTQTDPPAWKTTSPGRPPAMLVCEGPGNGWEGR